MGSKKKRPEKKTPKTELIQKDKKTNQVYSLIGILLLTFFAYKPMFNNEINNFDDEAYITQNPLIQELNVENLKKIFSEPYYGGYYPLTLLSFGIDLKIGGKEPLGILHFMNILLHLLNTYLVWLLVSKLFKKQNITIMATLLFGIHTLHVESVAWLSERKDVLYTFFFLLSLLSYLKYIQFKKIKFLIFTFLFFVLSIFSKTMAATLAVCLFAIDYFYQRKFNDYKIYIEKIPFIALAVIMGIVSINAQKSIGIITDDNQLNLIQKLVYAAYGYTVYLVKLIFPINLSAYYPYPEKFNPVYFGFLVPVIGIIYYLIKNINKERIIVFGILFFTINIAIVLQLLQINNFIIADRFSYIPSIGFFIIVAYLIDNYLIKSPKSKNSILIVLGIYIGALTVMTSMRTKVWKDSESIYSDMIDKFPRRIPKAYYSRAYIYLAKGMSEPAQQDFETVIENRDPLYLSLSYEGRARIFANQNKMELAMMDIDSAISIDSLNVTSYLLRAQIFANIDKKELALKDFSTIVRINPDDAVSYYYRASFLAQDAQYEKALIDYNKSIEINSSIGDVFYDRGIIKLKLKQQAEACKDFKTALNLGYERARNMIQDYCRSF